MTEGGAVVYKVGNTGYRGLIPEFNTWAEVTEYWLADQKKYWGERRYAANFIPQITLEESLAGWRIACEDAYEYTAFSDDGRVVRVNFRKGE